MICFGHRLVSRGEGMTRFATVNLDTTYLPPLSVHDRLLGRAFHSRPLWDGLGRAAFICTAWMLLEANSPLIPVAYAYQVERVCEQVATKKGTSEICKTKLVPGSEQMKPSAAPAKPDSAKPGSKDKKETKGAALSKP